MKTSVAKIWCRRIHDANRDYSTLSPEDLAVVKEVYRAMCGDAEYQEKFGQD